MNCKVFLLSLFLLVAVASAQTINTTSVAPPNTTTVAVKTTTLAPKNTTTTMQPANTTTTTPAPTTTPMPVPDPKNNYTVTEGNVTCVKMQAQIDFKITYEKVAGGKKENTTVTVPMPGVFTNTASSCKGSNGSQLLSIAFYKGWILDFVFKVDVSKANSDSYHIDEIKLTYVFDEHLPNATMKGNKTVTTSSGKDFVGASEDGYYVCKSQTSFDIEGDQLLTKDFKYRAFNKKAGALKFDGSANECSADEDTNSIVPIAVGAALAGLVVIVLIAYLIGRKRTRKTGYESV